MYKIVTKNKISKSISYMIYEITEIWETILYKGLLNLLSDEKQLYLYCRYLSLSDSKSRNLLFNLLIKHSNYINHCTKYVKLRRALCNIYGNLKPYAGEQKQIKLIGYDSFTNKLYFRVAPRSFGYKLVLLVKGTLSKPTVLMTTCEYVSLDKEYWSFPCSENSACRRTILLYPVYTVIIHSGIKIVQQGRFYYLDQYDNLDLKQLKIELPFPVLKKSFMQSGIINTLNLI